LPRHALLPQILARRIPAAQMYSAGCPDIITLSDAPH